MFIVQDLKQMRHPNNPNSLNSSIMRSTFEDIPEEDELMPTKRRKRRIKKSTSRSVNNDKIQPQIERRSPTMWSP